MGPSPGVKDLPSSTRRASIISSLALIVIFYSCSYYDDEFERQTAGSVVFTEEGYVAATFLHRNDSLFLSIENISGTPLNKLSFLIELFKDATLSREAKLYTRLIEIDSAIEAGEVVEVGFIYKNHPSFTKKTTRFNVISLQEENLFDKTAGLIQGKYEVADATNNKRSAFLISGSVNYKGDFTFSPQTSGDYFNTFSGSLDTSSPAATSGGLAGNFFGDAGKILASVQSTYVLSADSIIIADIKLSNQLSVTFRLKHLN